MKMSDGKQTIHLEDGDINKDVWERYGFKEVAEGDDNEDGVLSYQELKGLAKEKGINTHGMKKEEILEALGM